MYGFLDRCRSPPPNHDRRSTSPATAMMTECNGMWSTVKRAGEFNRPVPLSPSSICLALGGGAGDRELTSGERRGLAHVRKKVRVARSHTTTTRSVRSTTALDAPRRPVRRRKASANQPYSLDIAPKQNGSASAPVARTHSVPSLLRTYVSGQAVNHAQGFYKIAAELAAAELAAPRTPRGINGLSL